MTYKITYKRRFIRRTVSVAGHRYEPSMDKMVFYFADGSIEEVPAWSRCHVYLGIDWVKTVKEKMEKDAGVSVPVSVE